MVGETIKKISATKIEVTGLPPVTIYNKDDIIKKIADLDTIILNLEVRRELLTERLEDFKQ